MNLKKLFKLWFCTTCKICGIICIYCGQTRILIGKVLPNKFRQKVYEFMHIFNSKIWLQRVCEIFSAYSSNHIMENTRVCSPFNVIFKWTPYHSQFGFNQFHGNNVHCRATKVLLYMDKNFIYAIASAFFFYTINVGS